MKAAALLLALASAALAVAPSAAVSETCEWHPDFVAQVYYATYGYVHLHDGTPFCTVHVHGEPDDGPEPLP